MTRRLDEFDWLRVVAIGMILSCHYFRSVGNCAVVDLPLGAVGNVIFFAMSGWLLGIGWDERGCPAYGGSFLKHRLLRLAIPLWLFAIPWMTYRAMSGYAPTLREACLNLSLLNWFARIPGMTPYWFITAIAVFYFVVCMLTRIRRVRQNLICSAIVVALLCVGLQVALSAFGIRFGYILIMLMAGLCCFLCAKNLLLFVRRQHPLLLYVCVFVGGGLFCLLWRLYYMGMIQNGAPSGYWCALIVAVVIALMVLLFVRGRVAHGWIMFLSTMSYEIYLVHAAVLFGFMPIAKHPLCYLAVFLSLTFAGAYILHRFVEVIVRWGRTS